MSQIKDVDGRDKPGHDDVDGLESKTVGIIFRFLDFRSASSWTKKDKILGDREDIGYWPSIGHEAETDS